jgi:hypothetical protein
MPLIKNEQIAYRSVQIKPKGITFTMTYSRGRRGKLAIGWVALAFLVIALAVSQATRRLDLRLLDAQFNILRSMRFVAPVQEVALVGIDENTLAAFPEPIALWHKHFGDLLSALS